MSTATGLRESKKAATRSALSSAALRLSVERGPDAVTAEAIAAEAGVSTRTFHNYFASKEDAVLYQLDESVRRWLELFRARPADESIWESLEQSAIDMVTDPEHTVEEMCAMFQLVEESPALMAKKLRFEDNVTRLFGEALAERTGTDIDSDLYPNLVQVVFGGTVKTVLELAISGNAHGRTAQELMTEAFSMIRSGLPEPIKPQA